MPTKRLPMRQLREILRLRLHADLSLRQIKASLRLSLGAIQKIASKATELGLDWEKVGSLDDRQLAELFYPRSDNRVCRQLQVPDWPEVRQELCRKGGTKYLLWPKSTNRTGLVLKPVKYVFLAHG